MFLRIATIILGLMLVVAAPVSAKPLVQRHDLQCGKIFPCPPEIQRRVDFWIKVFRSWTTKQLVFHDVQRPERVYKVVDAATKSCRGRSSKRFVANHKKKIKKQLNGVAWKLQKGKKNFNATEKQLLSLFPARKSSEIYRAAKRIRCQQGNRDRFQQALKRFGRYRDLVVHVLTENKLPLDIQYLPFVESAYNPKAYSKAGAAGMWQIMPRTARSLGLELNATLDERLDPESATRAASRYFLNSINTLTVASREKDATVDYSRINPFVITSYNYGVSGMRRAIKQFGPDYLTVLAKYKSRSFRTAVRNFYASFLAARYVAINAEKYFGTVIEAPPLNYYTYVLKVPTSLKRVKTVFGVDDSQLKDLNRALTRYVWHGWRLMPKGYRLRLPARAGGYQSQVAALEKLQVEQEQWGGIKYQVKRGDTACGIASAFRVSCRKLIGLNGLNRRGFIRVGQNLTIPSKGVRLASANAKGLQVGADGNGYHVVRRGDTACKIARRYGVNCRQLIRQNSLGQGAVIHVGQRIRIPGKPVQVAAAAPLKNIIEKPDFHVVRRGDTACKIARRYAVDCRQLIQLNSLGSGALIYVGQKIRIPGKDVQLAAVSPKTVATPVPAANADENKSANDIPAPTALTLSEIIETSKQEGDATLEVRQEIPETPPVLPATESVDSFNAVLDNELDFTIKSKTIANKKRYFVYVEPEETLGHYADWLGIGRAGAVRRINSLKYGQQLHAGKRLYLPVSSARQAEAFNRKRQEYHRVLIELFKENYDVTGLGSYKVRGGDSIWQIAQKNNLPMWLIVRYNPQLRRQSPQRGELVTLPLVQSKSS